MAMSNIDIQLKPVRLTADSNKVGKRKADGGDDMTNYIWGC